MSNKDEDKKLNVYLKRIQDRWHNKKQKSMVVMNGGYGNFYIMMQDTESKITKSKDDGKATEKRAQG